MANEVTESMEIHFDHCASSYEQHTINDLGMKEIYDEIGRQISACKNSKHILVLGCGTGLEIERIQQDAIVTTLDLSAEMLKKLKSKTLYENVKLRTVRGSFMNVLFTNNKFDLILSTYALHYFNKKQKLFLYQNINRWLKPTGYFMNCDLVAKDKATETAMLQDAQAVYDDYKQEFGTLHIDTPLGLETEQDILREAGFEEIAVPRRWTEAVIFKALKRDRRGIEEEANIETVKESEKDCENEAETEVN